jgi:subtilisin family serine protease
MNAWRAADIAPIFAIGNSGPGCRSANSPGDRAAAIAVGATTLQDAVASFSSHGPSQVALRIKPDCSAPGQNVRSASHTSDTGYSILSGTSMACPHVAGAYAVLKSKTQSASIDEIATALYDSAVRPDFGNVVCTGGGVNITYPWPNNSFGWGRIDVRSALDRIF